MRESRREAILREGITTPDGRTWLWIGHTTAATRRGAPMRVECFQGTCPRCHGPHEVARKMPRGGALGYVFTHGVCAKCRRPKRGTGQPPADASDLV